MNLNKITSTLLLLHKFDFLQNKIDIRLYSTMMENYPPKLHTICKYATKLLTLIPQNINVEMSNFKSLSCVRSRIM
jgi:hypothetical protein